MLMGSLKKRGLWYWLGLLLLILPFLYNAVAYRSNIILESSIYSLNYGKYFSDLFRSHGHFFTGQYSIQLVGYSVLYGLLYLFGAVFGSASGYMVLLALLFAFGYHYLFELLGKIGKVLNPNIVPSLLLRSVICLLFFSSLTMFNFMKSNIIFLLPYLILPALLFWAVSYLEIARPKYLLLMLVVLLLATTFNITHLILIFGFTVIFTVIYGWAVLRLKPAVIARRTATVAAAFVPILIFVLAIIMSNSIYSGSAADFSSSATENFYSFQAHYLNIFEQTTDWGLFGSWQNQLYYGFSPFYESGIWLSVGLIPYFVFLVICGYLPKPSRTRLGLALLILLVLIFQFMMGSNNPVYNYLYNNLFGFQIFRNITKAAPMLYLTLLVTIYVMVTPYLNKLLRISLALAFLLSLLYNLPFWSYAPHFFSDRTISAIPSYWQDTANYLNTNLSNNDRILALPATYSLEGYNWSGSQKSVQGNLLDALLDNRLQSYRLGQVQVGPIEMQKDMGALFVPSERTVRHLDISYPMLTTFVQKYALDYVVVSKDLVNEYEHQDDIDKWLSVSGYSKVASFGQVDIYRNASQAAANSSISILDKVSDSEYLTTIPNISSPITLSALNYSKNWRIYPADMASDGSANWLRLGSSVFEQTHTKLSNFVNSWTIDPAVVKVTFPKDSYTVASDGSVTVRLRAFFYPQRYFYLGLSASLMAEILLVLSLGYAWWRKPVRTDDN